MRIDQLLVDKGLVESRHKAQALILAGKVLVNRVPVTKAGTKVLTSAEIHVKEDEIPYVSRGALKLEEALKTLEIDIAHDVCLDIGASTGGFTDCLLRHGADKVYAVDVGYGQLAWSLRNDERVVVLERTNIRYLTEEQVPEKVDLVTIDTSFISLKLVVPAALGFLKKEGRILALIKPQFEVGKGKVGKGGVVKDPAQHAEVIDNLSDFFQELGLEKEAVIPSPILGPKGNREFIISLKY
ncbi:TlyA family RNA methyltransferase [Desulfoluna butyratoxydans]|uniref:Haemolysin a /rrna methyltransferase tlya n=1 Tax=Desulfoluna butyratoxydans TaxID=231438 RepID=A0A4U8YS28_9BACT|nr:TlyA family RNA methyltransferase [Desulfoluna butyratoxydans]VFQ46701.1 haemolysin a /rrna methyltransferase tlya [Desulfoluna butyratoxydans]